MNLFLAMYIQILKGPIDVLNKTILDNTLCQNNKNSIGSSASTMGIAFHPVRAHL